jgi:hypothetical protein
MDTSKIEHYIKVGMGDKYWYEKAEQLFIDLYGEENLKLVAQVFAATSINTSMKSNITLFRRAFKELKEGLPFSNYLPNIKIQLEQIRNAQPLTGLKINAFAAAMSGDKNAVVVDVWLLRAFGKDRKYFRQGSQSFRSGGASPKDFKMIESWVREKALELGITPRQLSAIIWAGVRISQSGDRETHYEFLLRQKEFSMFNL